MLAVKAILDAVKLPRGLTDFGAMKLPRGLTDFGAML
jgi:hypothetical protein